MRVDRVKPGMLAKDDKGVWQVVVDRVGTCLYYPGGREEWALNEDVEAVRLTKTQVRGLRQAAAAIDTGGLRREYAQSGQWSSWVRDTGGTAGRLDLLADRYGLLVRGRVSFRDGRKVELYHLSPSGRALVDILDKEPTR